jgi:multiple sugar transport system substrate-binding protein
MTVSRRRLPAATATAVSAGALAACGGAASQAGGTTPAQSARPATVQFWTNWGNQFQVDGQTRVNQAFTSQVAPEVTVELTHFGANMDKLIAAVAGGTAPDVTTFSGSAVTQMARRSTIQPLDEHIGRSRIARRDKFYPAQLEAASYNGKVYALPAWEHGPGAFLFWNRQHFQEKGLDSARPPATLAELRQAAERLHEPAPGQAITRLGWQPLAESGESLLNYWANAYNVTWYDAKNRKISLVQPGLVAAVELIAAVTQRIGPANLAEFRKQYPMWNAANGASAQGAESMKISSYVSAGVLFKDAPALRLGIGWAPGEKAQKVIQRSASAQAASAGESGGSGSMR